jgi:hypothetical protein
MMRNQQDLRGRNTDSKNPGTPTQRPFTFGGQRGLNEPEISMRRGEGSQRRGFAGMSNPIQFGMKRRDGLDATWFPEGAELEVGDYVEEESLDEFSEISYLGEKGRQGARGRPDIQEQTQGKATVRMTEPKIARQHFYAIARGRETGVFLSWEEAEPLVKNFSGARHHRFDTVEEAMQYLDDFDHQVIPEPRISGEEVEKIRRYNAQRKAGTPRSVEASSYQGQGLEPWDLVSGDPSVDERDGYHGGNGDEVMMEGVEYQRKVEPIHHGEPDVRRDRDTQGRDSAVQGYAVGEPARDREDGRASGSQG